MIMTFKTTEELLVWLEKEGQFVKDNTEKYSEWTKNFRPGIYFARKVQQYGEKITIYGQVLELEPDEDEDAEMGFTDDTLYGKCYSQFCEEGEIGSIYPFTIQLIISKEDFEANKEAGWPQTPILSKVPGVIFTDASYFEEIQTKK